MFNNEITQNIYINILIIYNRPLNSYYGIYIYRCHCVVFIVLVYIIVLHAAWRTDTSSMKGIFLTSIWLFSMCVFRILETHKKSMSETLVCSCSFPHGNKEDVRVKTFKSMPLIGFCMMVDGFSHFCTFQQLCHAF